MTKKLITILTFLFILINPLYVNAQNFKHIEIFDPKQNKVVKVVQSTLEIQNILSVWVKNVQDIYGKNDPVTDDGYAIKVPFDPAIKVNSKSLSAIVNEVYIIIPKTEPPFYIIFEDENKASCYSFNGDINMLSTLLNFKLSCK